MNLRIYYYISGHGFGHISRASSIIEEMVNQDFISEIHIVSLRSSFLNIKNDKLKYREKKLDVGVSQKDSLSIDLDQTKSELIHLENEKTILLKSESEYIKQNKINLIITDSGSFPISIAVEVGIPSIFIGNFTWAFIYRNYARDDSFFSDFADRIEVEYTFATEALVLPFHCPMPHFLERTNVGLVGRRPNLSKVEARKKFHFANDLTYILLSFGAYGLEGKSLQTSNLPKHIKLVAFGVPGLQNEDILCPEVSHYPDLVTAVDFVCTKPGYGILSECYFAKTPILYTDRGNFAEYPYLVAALEDGFRCIYLDQDQIISCQFEEVLRSFESKDFGNKSFSFSEFGEKEIANRLLEYT